MEAGIDEESDDVVAQNFISLFTFPPLAHYGLPAYADYSLPRKGMKMAKGRKMQKEEGVLTMRGAMLEFKEAVAGPIEGRGEELMVRKKGGRKGMWLSCP